jgi:hypothetical protein
MVSTATTRNRLEKQGTGENTGTWGTKLNSATIDLIDAALDGRAAFTLSGDKTLSSTNYAADESRMRFIDVTGGTGGTVTIPSLEKWYLVRNAASGSATFTTGSGVTAAVAAGDTSLIACDATNVRTIGASTAYVAQAIAEASLSGIPGLSSEMTAFLTYPTSANLRAAVSDETGSGAAVFATSPTLTTPTINTPTISSPTISAPAFSGLADFSGPTRQNVTTVAASTINCTSGNYFTKTASGALTWAFSNVPSGAFVAILELTNGGTGTQTWPASVKWPGGTAPTLTASGVDVLAFLTDDGGTTWRASQLMRDSK